MKWDKRFLKMSQEVAGWSKDPSAQIGCVAVNDNRQILSTGYNGFPRGINDTEERYSVREEKYKYVVHAEMNAIYNATWNGVSLNGSTFYVYGLPVCSECAKGIIQSGVKRVVMHGDLESIPDRWIQSWNNTKKLFDEAGVKYEFIKESE
jgi:dCMP deaminase